MKVSGYDIDPLAPICELDHPVSELARDYLARDAEWTVDDWFVERTQMYFQGQDTSVEKALSLEDLPYALETTAQRKVRFISIRPYYFRGFRQRERPINLDADLVTVDGRNSSGKTSLAEAIEWLLTARIQRREQGDAGELAAFVANRFRPKGQPTWVEGVLDVDGVCTKIKRVLVDDYGLTKKSFCTTRLFIDDKEVKDSTDVLADYFSGAAPLLMQHTLREFVLESPVNRPKYFEKLLNMDRMSALIEDAQVSKLRQSDIPRPRGATALADWQKLTQSVGEAHFQTVEQYSKLDSSVLGKKICDALVRVAVDEFGARCESNIESCIAVMSSLQERELQRSFPLLQNFRPKENLTQATFVQFSTESQNSRLQRLEKARTDYRVSLESQKTISDANISIAKAVKELRNAGLIKDEDRQICPVCDYQPVPTLTKGRLNDIDSWTQVRVEQARGEFEKAAGECLKAVEDLGSLRRNLVPSTLPEDTKQNTGEIANSDSFKTLLTAHADAGRKLRDFDNRTSLALAELKKRDLELDIRDTLRDAFSVVPILQRCAEEYARKFGEFQQYLSELATSKEDYRARDNWLKIARNRDELILDIQWEAAKDMSRNELVVCRDLLIAARQKYLEPRRRALNDGIAGIWSRLRRDGYSAFSELVIPEPKGRGQKARFEVKAKLNNNSRTQEVHALSVLSESQINAIGIAAFVTRSRLLGHNVLVFDDPVQSMDDDHFKSFAGDVLSYLCDSGFQVIVLTHNDDFARDVTLSHSDRESRISMKIRHTGKRGIGVDEGNRSVLGLLNMGLAYWEDGEYDTAWVRLRTAIERQYMLIRMKRGTQPFEWRQWKGLSAEKMWKRCVKKLVLRLFPDIVRRLPEIVFMTGSGAHIRQADGETDFRSAVDDIRSLQCRMEVGD